VDYTLNLTLEMSMSNDIVGPDYEPYGWLAIDIGHRTDNQNVTLWHVEKNDYLSIEYGVILQLGDTKDITLRLPK